MAGVVDNLGVVAFFRNINAGLCEPARELAGAATRVEHNVCSEGAVFVSQYASNPRRCPIFSGFDFDANDPLSIEQGDIFSLADKSAQHRLDGGSPTQQHP